jgi:hypothetical protein
VSILSLGGLIEALASRGARGFEPAQLASLRAYRAQYGIAN